MVSYFNCIVSGTTINFIYKDLTCWDFNSVIIWVGYVVSRESRCWKCKNNTHCLRCANCKIARYCGAECQKQDWRSHLILCRKIKSSISNNKEPTYEVTL